MDFISLFLAISAIAIANSLFFGVYLLTLRKKSVANLYLALLLFSLAIRISKSVIVIAFPNAPEIFPALGLIGMATIGPFLYLYVNTLAAAVWKKWTLAHFVPALLLVFLIPTASEPTIYLFYQLVVGQLFIYLLLSFYISRKLDKTETKSRWIFSLLAGVALIWLAFLVQLVYDSFISYFVATSTAAIVLYSLGFKAMKRQKLFYKNGRKNGSNSERIRLSGEIKDLFENKKAYLDFEITIQKVAKLLMVQPYQISQAVNDQFEKSFPEMLNDYRVNEVKERLCDPRNSHLSIEAIAYDSGFVTPSAFYTTFKKVTGKTPGQFRRQLV